MLIQMKKWIWVALRYDSAHFRCPESVLILFDLFSQFLNGECPESRIFESQGPNSNKSVTLDADSDAGSEYESLCAMIVHIFVARSQYRSFLASFHVFWMTNAPKVEFLRAKGPIQTKVSLSMLIQMKKWIWIALRYDSAHFRCPESALIISDLFSRFLYGKCPTRRFLRAKGPIQTKVSLSMLIQTQEVNMNRLALW